MKKSEMIHLLQRVPIFNKFTIAELEVMFNKSQIKKFKKRDYIFTERSAGDAVYIIISGSVKVFKTSSSGERKTLSILRKGDFFGEMAELDQPVRSASVQSLEEVELIVLDRKQFVLLLQRNPEMMMSILRALSARLRAADEQIKNLVFQNVYGRLAISLLDLSSRYGVKQGRLWKIDLNLSQDELAQLIGSSREIVNKALQLFQRQRLIEIKNKSICIVNREGLRKCIS